MQLSEDNSERERTDGHTFRKIHASLQRAPITFGFALWRKTNTNTLMENRHNSGLRIQITLKVPTGANFSCLCFALFSGDEGKNVVVFILAFFWLPEASDANENNRRIRVEMAQLWCPHRAHTVNCEIIRVWKRERGTHWW